jgi:hypothetical protein
MAHGGHAPGTPAVEPKPSFPLKIAWGIGILVTFILLTQLVSCSSDEEQPPAALGTMASASRSGVAARASDHSVTVAPIKAPTITAYECGTKPQPALLTAAAKGEVYFLPSDSGKWRLGKNPGSEYRLCSSRKCYEPGERLEAAPQWRIENLTDKELTISCWYEPETGSETFTLPATAEHTVERG